MEIVKLTRSTFLVSFEHLEQNRQILSNITSAPAIIIHSTDYASKDFQKGIVENNIVLYIAGYQL